VADGFDQFGVPYIASNTRIHLGVPDRAILPLCERWFNDFQTSRTLGVNWHPLTTEIKGRYLDEILTANDPTFIIYERESETPVGLSGLSDINQADGTAEFSILIGEKSFWGKGFGTDATLLTLQYAFDVLGLYNVWLQVTSNNPGGIRAYEKAGFRRIGVRRTSVRVGRQVIDDVYMDAIADDFEPSAFATLMHPPEETR
jgi:RimJ/RimL family protein N-acetyltransferase